MIEIIIEEVVMPPVSERKYKKDCQNNKWVVIDTEDNSTRYKGSFENVATACHNLNKSFYKQIKTVRE